MNEKLQQLMKDNGLTEESIFYRYTFPEFLKSIDGNRFKLSANDQATEIVVDVYQSGLREMAHNFGKGLTFLSERDESFELPDKICVKMQLKEILQQGGLLYPDESSFVEGAFFMTMPEGEVEVEKVAES